VDGLSTVTRTFREIELNAQPYPAFLIPSEGTALALFAAGFLGWNDVIHFTRKKLTVDCVDTDKDKLWEMATIYPEGHAFHVDDAWQFAERAFVADCQWDVVSVDTFLGEACQRSLNSLDLWTGIARRLVTVTMPANLDVAELKMPDGWLGWQFPRSSRAAWLVMKHA